MSLAMDLRVAARALRQTPTSTLVAIVVLGLAIGANSAMLTLVNALVLKPLPVENPERLSGVLEHDMETRNYSAISYPNFADLRSGARAFDGITAHNIGLVGIGEGSATRRAFADLVASNFFDTFGVAPELGRFFTAEEERPDALTPVAVLGYKLFQRMGGTPDVLGQQIRVNGQQLTVVGVAPRGFAGTSALVAPEIFLPLSTYPWMNSLTNDATASLSDRSNGQLLLVGKRSAGISVDEANRDLARVSAVVAEQFPAENDQIVYEAHPLSRISISTSPETSDPTRPLSVLLLAMAFVVLLVAGINLATVQGAKVLSRRRELAVRLAVGCSRRLLVRALILECLLLALGGAALGFALAYFLPNLISASISRLAPIDLLLDNELDWRVLLGTLGFAVAAAVIVGLVPALRASRPDLVTDLKDGADAGTPTFRSGLWARLTGRRRLLMRGDGPVLVELALAMVLLVSAGLFVKAAWNSTHIDPGFDLDRSVHLEIDPSLVGYDEARGADVALRLRDRLDALPRVQSAALAVTVPYGIVSMGVSVAAAGEPPPEDGSLPGVGASYNAVSSAYFEALGIPLLEGRTFREVEPNPVAIVDEDLARTLWPDAPAVGQRVDFGETGRAQGEAEVIGVAANIRDSVFQGGDSSRRVYLPHGTSYIPNMHLHLSVSGDPNDPALLRTVREAVAEVDELLPILNLRSLRQHQESSFEVWTLRAGGQIFATFAGIALALALAGVYGVRAFSVARRAREIGLRMALGATVRDTMSMILREGGRVALLGVGLGLMLSLAVARLLEGFLFGVSAFDPLVFGAAAFLLGGVAIAACVFPARRASRLDPLVALREE